MKRGCKDFIAEMEDVIWGIKDSAIDMYNKEEQRIDDQHDADMEEFMRKMPPMPDFQGELAKC